MPVIFEGYMKNEVLPVNLGSPDRPKPEVTKPYLSTFLMDEQVIDVPFWLIAMIDRILFFDSGSQSFTLVPDLNADDAFVEILSKLSNHWTTPESAYA